jgi:hypothetical protein
MKGFLMAVAVKEIGGGALFGKQALLFQDIYLMW